jgi:hypothetical protein
MAKSRWYLLAAGLAGAVAVVLGLRAARAPSPARGVLQAAPADAWLVVTADVVAARPLLEPFFRSAGGLSTATRAAGLGSITAACGFDPVEHLRELMVAAPEGGERGDFGIAFSVDLTKDELASCARKAIAARGGSPSTTTRGDYAVIGDESDPGQARLAYRDRGPFLVGRGAWLDAMIDAAASRGARAPARHLAMRATLAPPSGPPRALVLTALLPKSLRDRLRASEAEAGAAASAAFEGVLGVEEAGAAVTASDTTTAIEVALRCETAAACLDVKELIEKGRRALAGDFAVRLLGFGPLVDSLIIDSTVPAALGIRTRAPTGDLAEALARLWSRVAPPSRVTPATQAPSAQAPRAADR